MASESSRSLGTRRPAPVTSARDLFASIDSDLFGRHIGPIARRIATDMIREIREGVPVYGFPLNGEFGRILVTSVERAIIQVVESMRGAAIDTTAWDDWFRHVGRIQYLEGWSMDAMQSAIRIGTRVAWRHIRAASESLGVPSDVTFTFADALFRYTDELAAVAIAGYTEAQAQAQGTMERRRQQLLRMLTSADPASPQAVAELAGATGWPLPAEVCVVALEKQKGRQSLPDTMLDRDILVDLESDHPCLVVPGSPAKLAGFELELNGRKAAIGPVVPLVETHRSLATARRAIVLARRGLLDDGDMIQCADHLTTLALCADEFLLKQLSDRALAPLAGLTVKQRTRLSETLFAWLGARGGVNEVADRLGIHPQTVRYRMNQITDLFGARLDDPDERLELEIALRARQLTGPGDG